MKKIFHSQISFLLFTAIAFAETPHSLHWINVDRFSKDVTAETFENTAIDYLTLAPFTVRRSDLKLSELESQLKMAAQDPQTIMLIYCSLKEYEQILKEPSTRQLLRTMELQPVNARLFTIPFYIVGLAQDPADLPDRTAKTESLDVAFITLPVSDATQLQEADLLTMLSEILGKPKSAIKVYQERGPYTIAKKLYEGNYQLAGIYEDEPSLLLDEFEINLTEELKAPPPQLFPFPPKWLSTQLQIASPDRLEYLFFAYQGTPFAELDGLHSGSPIAAIALRSAHNFPVLLSNVQARFPESHAFVSRALSFAYFLLLPSLSGTADQETAEKMYLLNAYLNDPQNQYKSLGFLAYLLLSKERRSGSERELYAGKAELLQKKMQLSQLKAEEILKWLNIPLPELHKRELFTSDVSRLYESAVSKIEEGRKQSGKKRVQILEDARRELIAALLKGEEPRRIQGGRGMWSVRNYNPYYQLARVTFILQMGETP